MDVYKCITDLFVYGVKSLRRANIHSGGYGTIWFVSINTCICSYREPYEYISLHFIPIIEVSLGARGCVVVKALRYKPAGHGFDSRYFHWNFSVT